MILGHGDIGSILNDRKGAIFFASGVSNSSCTDEAQFKRERDLLLAQDQSQCLFYFSSIAIFTESSPYYWHKAKMELTIKSNFNNYNIIRLGNISFGKNPNTFLNYLKAKKEAGEPYEIKDEYRYMINEEELLLMTDNLPLKGQNIINVFGTKAKVADLI